MIDFKKRKPPQAPIELFVVIAALVVLVVLEVAL